LARKYKCARLVVLTVSYHNLSMEDATELALDRPLRRLLAASTDLMQAEQR